jgi:hypothetical protein
VPDSVGLFLSEPDCVVAGGSGFQVFCSGG